MFTTDMRAGTLHFPRAARATARALRRARRHAVLRDLDSESKWLTKLILTAIEETAAGNTIEQAADAAILIALEAQENWAKNRPTGTAIN